MEERRMQRGEVGLCISASTVCTVQVQEGCADDSRSLGGAADGVSQTHDPDS